jgi:hypothetical protein
VTRKITYLKTDGPEQFLEIGGMNTEQIEFYDTLHKGDNITIETGPDISANGSYKILRKYRRGDKVKFKLQRNEVV